MWHSWLEFIYANRILSDQYTHLGLRDNGRCDCGKNSISYPHWPLSTVNKAFDQYSSRTQRKLRISVHVSDPTTLLCVIPPSPIARIPVCVRMNTATSSNSRERCTIIRDLWRVDYKHLIPNYTFSTLPTPPQSEVPRLR
jgi:hypothetical protein